jgi:hypothetical protein
MAIAVSNVAHFRTYVADMRHVFDDIHRLAHMRVHSEALFRRAIHIRLAQTAFILVSTFLDLRPVSDASD